MKQVCIFTATQWELNAVRRVILLEEDTRVAGTRRVVGRRGHCRLILCQTGVGTEKAAGACREVLAGRPVDLIVSCGFACALTPSRVGDLLIGTEVVLHQDAATPGDQARPFACAADLVAAALRAAREAGATARAGRVVTVPRVLWRAEEKRAMAARTGALGGDMESAAIGAAAADRQVPFAVIRAVSDLLDEDLPFDFNLCLGSAGWLRGAGICLARPSVLRGLRRLRAQARLASERMTGFFGRFFDALV